MYVYIFIYPNFLFPHISQDLEKEKSFVIMEIG